MRTTFPFIIMLISILSSCNKTTETINLFEREIASQWTFRQANGTINGKATVPGTIHTDLLNEGLIEDPFYRTNERDLQWIDKEDWEYATTLTFSADELKKENLTLFFEGLDTYADVYLNDQLLLKTDNMFRQWEVSVKEIAREGENQLRIYFHSPVKIGLAMLEKEGHGYPASNDQSENGGLGDQKVSIFTRKAGYHYGWDWGPRFVTSGIWKPVLVKSWDKVRINNTFIQQKSINAELAELNAAITLDLNTDIKGKLIVTDMKSGEKLATQKINLTAGTHQAALPFTIENPNLWWSAGLGEPHLYHFKIELLANNQIIARSLVSTGLRDIKLIREKDEEGESFVFQLNGVKIFAKGANYIPNDNFLPRVTPAQYEKVVADAVNANMNMLRIWGGGIYENDYFYELCDRNGILVWQDFMFACSMYPGDEAFLENVKQEAIDNVIRLRNHPSIALWCGNNEINTAWSYFSNGGWGWKQQYTDEQRDKLQKAYMDIFHTILPEVVTEYTDGDDYWPSSPQAGYEANQHATYESPSGDTHYWGVWHGLHAFEDFEKYRSRFMSEFGFQSFPEFETVQSYALPEDYNIESEVMASHQRSGIGNLRIKEYMSWYFNVPTDFEDFLYMSHVLQAYGMRMGIEAHRRAMPYCMGSLYWQINDCWPVASWSSTDYYHKWKAMHYGVKRAFEATLLSAFKHDQMVEIYGVTDRLNDAEGVLKLQLMSFDGTIIEEESIQKTMVNNTSTLLFTSDMLLKGQDSTAVVLNMEWIENNEVVASNLFYFAKPKQQQLSEPVIEYALKEQDGKWYIEIASDQLARYVFLNIDGENEFFTDNYFDLLPGQKRLIEIHNFSGNNEATVMIKHLQQMN
jgi:beta-mannosidase